MSKHTRRVTLTRTNTYTVSIDVPGRPEISDADALTVMGGAAGTAGILSLGESLSGSAANNGNINRSVWSVSSSSNVEGYGIRPQNSALTAGQRILSIAPPLGSEGAISKTFFVSVAGTTANSTEPAWNLSDGLTTADGTVTYRTLPKFPTLTTFVANTVYAIGTILRPSANSMKEFLVTTATTTGTTTPTWSAAAGGFDTVTGSPVSMPVAGAVICIAGAKVFANLTAYFLGDVVKPSSASAEEYLVTVAGTSSSSTALTATVGNTQVNGTASFKRIV